MGVLLTGEKANIAKFISLEAAVVNFLAAAQLAGQ
jgi:hypothetical protein